MTKHELTILLCQTTTALLAARPDCESIISIDIFDAVDDAANIIRASHRQAEILLEEDSGLSQSEPVGAKPGPVVLDAGTF